MLIYFTCKIILCREQHINYIDDFRENAVNNYIYSNCIINFDENEKIKDNRSIQIRYDLKSGYSSFYKSCSYNARHTAGIVFSLKGDSTANIIQPFFKTSSGNWICGYKIKCDYSLWEEYYLPWRLFCGENASIYMTPEDAEEIVKIGFGITGSGTGMISIANLRFFNSYDICNFESSMIDDFEEGSLSEWIYGSGSR